jgi:hypothetical protein
VEKLLISTRNSGIPNLGKNMLRVSFKHPLPRETGNY